MWACKNGYFHIVRIFLNTPEVDVNKQRISDGATALMLASYNGHTDVVDMLLSQERIDVGTRTTSTGDSAMIMASSRGHEDVVKLFVQAKKIALFWDIFYSPLIGRNHPGWHVWVNNVQDRNRLRRGRLEKSHQIYTRLIE